MLPCRWETIASSNDGLFSIRSTGINSRELWKKAWRFLLKFPLPNIGYLFRRQVAGIILCMRPANERRRYKVRWSPIARAYTQNNPFKCPMYYVCGRLEGIPTSVQCSTSGVTGAAVPLSATNGFWLQLIASTTTSRYKKKRLSNSR